ncbi:DM13 domain-containing protein [Candidatus Halocynthiibacter alkanivorans]|uniref:DM13 domain-containing protein n=1 Tax=Candidatus Halocynthiibacter alkanivorans TaxID=2267619 RepID=UPI000DF45B73|nr:DM13 domain-containing protein [Candidatus Halocynthiibacter alkanivorans]
MKRFLLIAIPSFIAGVIFGAAFWYLASPLWIDRVVNETLAQGEDVMIVAEGSFRDADAAHRGKGNARMVALPGGGVEVQLSGFEVTNGPDLELWLSDHPDPASSADVTAGNWLSLGLLKGNIGDQSYSVPAGTDLSQYRSVVVWCEQFGVLFSAAPFGSPDG